MRQYIGTKVIMAEPSSRNGIAQGTGVDVEGYTVVYPDGYTSWSPKAAFDEAYRPTDGMTFGLAIEALKKGSKVARAGWNGKGMWLGLVANWNGQIGAMSPNYGLLPWIGMKTADDKFVPWLASQTDMLSDDWVIVA